MIKGMIVVAGTVVDARFLGVAVDVAKMRAVYSTEADDDKSQRVQSRLVEAEILYIKRLGYTDSTGLLQEATLYHLHGAKLVVEMDSLLYLINEGDRWTDPLALDTVGVPSVPTEVVVMSWGSVRLQPARRGQWYPLYC